LLLLDGAGPSGAGRTDTAACADTEEAAVAPASTAAGRVTGDGVAAGGGVRAAGVRDAVEGVIPGAEAGFSCLQFKKSIVATGRDDYIARVGIYIKDLRETLNELFNTNGNAIIDYSIEPPRVFF
jgi:hypothetical protein